MSSRGTFSKNGHVTTDEYSTVSKLYDAKILVGNDNRHSLPDYSHSPNAIYIKQYADGSFREMRIFDEKGFPILEIAYHIEPGLTGNRHEYVLHAHWIEHNKNLDRHMICRISPTENSDIYNKYKKYLKEYGL